MRAVLAFAMLGALAACDDAAQSDAPQPAREITAELVEAGRACAELTGYAPAAQTEKSPEALALLEKEYNACVAAVTDGGAKPALRGRTESATSDAPLVP